MVKFSDLAATTNFKGKTVYLACDIDMTDITYTPFAGTFDGRGYALKELKISTTGTSSGVFATTTTTAVIRNFGVVGGTVTAVCATDAQRVGSIVGVNNGTVMNSYFKGSASGGASVGGIAGINRGNVISSYAVPTSLSAAAARGGVVGFNLGTSTRAYYLTNSDYSGTGFNKGSGAGSSKSESSTRLQLLFRAISIATVR